MDPFTMMAIANAFPAITQMANQPSLPGNNLSGQNYINLGAYQPYFSQVMQNGFNPQAQQYQNASQVANSAMKNKLAGSGTLNSSAGDMALAGLNTNLANSYINNQMNRQQQALQTVGNFQNGAMQSNLNLGQANNQQGWNTFGGQTQNGQAMSGGLNSLLSGFSGAYGAYSKNQQQQLQQKQAQDNFNQYMFMMNNGGGGYGNMGGMSYSNPGGSGSSSQSLSL